MCKTECAEIFQKNKFRREVTDVTKIVFDFQSYGRVLKNTLSKQAHYENMSHHSMSIAI